MKNANDPSGTTASWVAVPEVYRAVELLERLGLSDQWLFGIDKTSLFTLAPLNFARGFSQFIKHANTLADVQGNSTKIPTDVRVNEITPRSFRRTLAWYLAQQPFGIVAGMLQLKHVKVSTFEGYSGTSLSGFKEELEQARKVSNYFELRLKYERYKDGYPVVVEQGLDVDLKTSFQSIQQEVNDFPGMVVDSFRLTTLLSVLSADLYRGPLSDCLFDPSKALCKPSDIPVENFTEPILATCKILNCACSIVDCSKQAEWVRVRDSLSVLENNKSLSPFEHEYVCMRRTSADKVLLTLSSRIEEKDV